jgi:hypothetical protein
MDNFDVHEWNKNRYLNRIEESDDPKLGGELEAGVEGDRVEESQSQLEFLAQYLNSMHPELDWEVSFGERIDAYGSAQDLANFGNKYHGKKFGEYEVFHVDDDDRLDIVRIVKSDSILRNFENINEYSKYDNVASHDYKDYKDKHFDICPAAEGLRDRLLAGEFKDNKWATGTNFEKEVGEWLYRHDILFQIEKQVLKDKKGDQSDVEDAKKAIDRIVNLSRDLGIPAAEISYLKAHLKKITDVVESSSLTELNPIKETIKFIMDDLEGYSNYFPGGKTKGLSSDEMSTILMQIVKDIEKEGEQLDEGSMCKRGKNYMAARKRAGEKSSAYLSGRGVKVCKGQIKGSDGKKKKSFESLNEVNNSDIVKALAKVVDMEPKDVVAKIKADKEEVNEIAITTAITIAGLLPAAMELVGGAFNKSKNSFKLNEKEKTEYLALQQFYKEAKDKDEKKRLKKEMEPYESKIGNWFKDAGHSLHKAYTAPIRGLLWMASKLAPKDSSLKDKEKREKIANVIYAASMIGIAGYGVASHIGHLKGVSDVAITIADSIKGGKSIKDAALGGLELLGLL